MTALLLDEKELKILWNGLNMLLINEHIAAGSKGFSTAEKLLIKKVQIKVELHKQIAKMDNHKIDIT